MVGGQTHRRNELPQGSALHVYTNLLRRIAAGHAVIARAADGSSRHLVGRPRKKLLWRSPPAAFNPPYLLKPLLLKPLLQRRRRRPCPRRCELLCRLGGLLMRVASKADADAPLNGSERNETAANEAVEAALRYFEEAERMDSSYAPALVGMAQIEMRAAEAAIASGKIDKASENLELAATFLGDSFNLGEPTIAARRALVECLTAATVLPKSEQLKFSPMPLCDQI